MAKANWVLLILAAVLVALILLAPQLAWRLRAFFAPEAPDSSGRLALENDALKTELAKLQNAKSQLAAGEVEQLLAQKHNYIGAVVLSRYPMNFKNEFLVGAGAAQGIKKGNAVVFAGVLIGRVEKAFQDTALVKTVFDSGFQSPVRIGQPAVDALFRGGLVPQVALIPLGARVNQGDIVYSASPDLPYGLAIGRIKETKISKDKLFREAALDFAYDVSEIRAILIDAGR